MVNAAQELDRPVSRTPAASAACWARARLAGKALVADIRRVADDGVEFRRRHAVEKVGHRDAGAQPALGEQPGSLAGGGGVDLDAMQLPGEAVRRRPQGAQTLTGGKQKGRLAAGWFEHLVGRRADGPGGEIGGDGGRGEEGPTGFAQTGGIGHAVPPCGLPESGAG